MIAMTSRPSVLALDDDQRVSMRGLNVVVDQRIAERIFVKVAEVGT